MLLFLELVSTYLGGPLLHEGSFQVKQGGRLRGALIGSACFKRCESD